ncbi:MAG: heparan-alpha-glucosaminide N-acetyltransferase domain-containing protein, partial [Croceimicrobium sp.]
MSEASGTEPNKASSTEPSNAASKAPGKASGKAAKNKQKIVGLSVARAIAIIGMIIVNFKIVIGSEGPGWLQAVADVFSGKAAATFVVLAGLGLSLMAKSAQDDPLKKRKVQWKVFKRALFLFVIGLSYYFIWPADILHYYGLYMLLGLALLFRPPSYSFRIALGLIILFPILLFNFNYETGWNFES